MWLSSFSFVYPVFTDVLKQIDIAKKMTVYKITRKEKFHQKMKTLCFRQMQQSSLFSNNKTF